MSRTDRSATEGALESFLASSERFSGKYHNNHPMRESDSGYRTRLNHSQGGDKGVHVDASLSHYTYTQTPTQAMLNALRTGNGIRPGTYATHTHRNGGHDSERSVSARYASSKPFSPYVDEKSATNSNVDERSDAADPYSVEMSNEEGYAESETAKLHIPQRKNPNTMEYARTNTHVFRDDDDKEEGGDEAPAKRNVQRKGPAPKCPHCRAHTQALDYAWKCYLEEQQGKVEAMQRAIVVEEEGARRALQVEAIFRARILYAIFMETCAHETLRLRKRSSSAQESGASENPTDTRALLDKWHALVSMPSPLKSTQNRSRSDDSKQQSRTVASARSEKQAIRAPVRGTASATRRQTAQTGALSRTQKPSGQKQLLGKTYDAAAQRHDDTHPSRGVDYGVPTSDTETATTSTGAATSRRASGAAVNASSSSSSWYKKVLHPRRLPRPQHEAGELLSNSKPTKGKGDMVAVAADPTKQGNQRSRSSQLRANNHARVSNRPTAKHSALEESDTDHVPQQPRHVHQELYASDTSLSMTAAADGGEELERLRLENAKLKREQETTQQLLQEDKMEWNELYKNMTDAISSLTRERNSLAQSITHDSTLLSARQQPSNWEGERTMLRGQDSIERQLQYGAVHPTNRSVATGFNSAGESRSHMKWTPIKEMDNAIPGLSTPNPYSRNTDYGGSEVAMSPDELTFSHISPSPLPNRQLNSEHSPIATVPQPHPQFKTYSGMGGIGGTGSSAPQLTRSRDQQEGSVPVRESTVAPPDPYWSHRHLLYQDSQNQPLQRSEVRDPRTLLGIGKAKGEPPTAKSGPPAGSSPLKDVRDDDEFGSYRRRVLPY